MAVTFGFYNSLNGDRKYNVRDLNTLFDGLINDGIFMSIGDKMMVTAAGGMTVNVGVGRAWFNRTWTYNDAILPITLDQSEIVLNRIDAIILEVDSSDAVRKNSIKIKKGTPATNPVNPAMTKSAQLNQYPLAYIRVNKLATEITQANITNAVGTTATPFVTGIIQSMNIDDLIAQWGTEWGEWTEERTTAFNQWFLEQSENFLQWRNSEESDYYQWSSDRRMIFDNWFNAMQGTIGPDSAMNITNMLLEHKNNHIGHIYYGHATGKNDKIVTPQELYFPLEYIEGLAIAFKNEEVNNGPVTINIANLGPKELRMHTNTPIRPGRLVVGGIYTARYNGEVFILQEEGVDKRVFGDETKQVSTYELMMRYGFDPVRALNLTP